jgi:PEP-CTERM motif-containing protein
MRLLEYSSASSTFSHHSFLYQNFVRGQFLALETVPEPGTWLLMAVGLVWLVVAARRREIF